MERKSNLIRLAVGFLGAMLGLLGVVTFSLVALMDLPLGLRMVSMIVVYWLIALAPLLIIFFCKERLPNYGFVKNKIGMQVLIGIFVALAMSFVLTVIPHLLGFGMYVDSGKRYQYLWQFVYEFVYCIIGIGAVEEFVFRGFIFEAFQRISNHNLIAAIGSSVLFGIFHLFNGSVVQMVMTACIGLFFCFCRLKIKNCSMLSLIIAHGIYDALITVWASVFL